MNIIEDKIKKVWQTIDTKINKHKVIISSEKSVVFNFAWEFCKEFPSDISSIDFENCLFENFSDGQFLDLLIQYRQDNKVIKIGIEFKYPNKKGSTSDHTNTRQKIINDLKRLNWLVANNKIDIGCFLCMTNEINYIHIGKFRVAKNFLTHQGYKYNKDDYLPENEDFAEKVIALNDMVFNWKHILKNKNKVLIKEDKVSFLEPIFITKKKHEPLTSGFVQVGQTE